MNKILKSETGETSRFFNTVVNVFGAATVILAGFLTMLQFAAV